MASIKARTAPSIIAGILLLCIPPAFLLYQVLLFAAIHGPGSLQDARQILVVFQQFGIGDVFIFIIAPFLSAICIFRRTKGLVALSCLTFVFACASNIWTCTTEPALENYPLGFILQMALVGLSWLLLLIVALVGAKKAVVKVRLFPWVLSLAASIACAVQWFTDISSTGDISFAGANILMVAGLADVGVSFLMSLALLCLGLAVGKASKKEIALAEEEKATRAAEKARLKEEKKQAKKGVAKEPAPVQVVGSEDTTYAFELADKDIALSSKGDPFAQALAALDEAHAPITLTLDGAGEKDKAPTESTAGTSEMNASVASAAPKAPEAPKASGIELKLSGNSVTTSPATSTTHGISDLESLLKEGILTPAEFEAQKNKLTK